jgi:hypothetical protein
VYRSIYIQAIKIEVSYYWGIMTLITQGSLLIQAIAKSSLQLPLLVTSPIVDLLKNSIVIINNNNCSLILMGGVLVLFGG